MTITGVAERAEMIWFVVMDNMHGKPLGVAKGTTELLKIYEQINRGKIVVRPAEEKRLEIEAATIPFVDDQLNPYNQKEIFLGNGYYALPCPRVGFVGDEFVTLTFGDPRE